MIKNRSLLVAGALTIAFGSMLVGQSAKKAGKGPGVLQPQMAPVGGADYSKAMGTMGEKSAEPWSQTTVGAGVDGKPLAGKPITVTGEIVDFSCYLQLGKHGEKHRACGQKCAKQGQPIGLLTGSGELYMVMEEEHDPRRDGLTMEGFRAAASDHMAHVMEVSGTMASHAGYKAIYVSGFVKK